MNSLRDARLDSIKGALIIIVVIGHCIELTSNQGYFKIAYNTIYSFHMPLFIFITGYFTNTKKNKIQFINDSLNLLSAFIIFQSIRLFCFSNDFRISTILSPQWTLWYLLSTFCWRLSFYILKSLGSSKLLVISVILSFIGGFIPLEHLLSIQRTLSLGVFFALGYYIRDKQMMNKIYNIPQWVMIPITVICFIIIISFFDENLGWLLFGRYYYSCWPVSLEYCLILRLIWIVFACFMSILFIKQCPLSVSLQKIGRETLFIYIYHGFVLDLLKMVRWNLSDFLILIISFSITILSLTILHKVKLLHFFLNPLKNFQKYHQNHI